MENNTENNEVKLTESTPPDAKPPKKKNNIFGVLCLVFAIIGFCTAFAGGFGVFLDVVAIIFAIIAFTQAKKVGKVGLQIAGLAIALISIIVYSTVLAGLHAVSDALNAEGSVSITTSAPVNVVESEAPSVETAASEAAAPAETEAPVKVGDTINDGDLAITITSIDKFESKNEFVEPKDGNYFLRVELHAINNSKSDVTTVSSWSFTAYSDGESINETFVDSDDKDFSGEVGPGKKISGAIFYEIPTGTKEFELDYAPSFLSNKRIPIIVELAK